MYETTSTVIFKQYQRCVRKITITDYPEKWPSLLPDILEAVKSPH